VLHTPTLRQKIEGCLWETFSDSGGIPTIYIEKATNMILKILKDSAIVEKK